MNKTQRTEFMKEWCSECIHDEPDCGVLKLLDETDASPNIVNMFIRTCDCGTIHCRMYISIWDVLYD